MVIRLTELLTCHMCIVIDCAMVFPGMQLRQKFIHQQPLLYKFKVNNLAPAVCVITQIMYLVEDFVQILTSSYLPFSCTFFLVK